MSLILICYEAQFTVCLWAEDTPTVCLANLITAICSLEEQFRILGNGRIDSTVCICMINVKQDPAAGQLSLALKEMDSRKQLARLCPRVTNSLYKPL